MNLVRGLIENGKLKLIHTDMNMKRKLYIIYLKKRKLGRQVWEFVDICSSLMTDGGASAEYDVIAKLAMEEYY